MCNALCCSIFHYFALLDSSSWCDILDLSGYFNTLRPRQNGRHFPDDIFKWIFVNENVWISINISLKFVPRGPVNNIPTLVQVMAWCRPGDKPLSEPMTVSLLTHICVNRPHWVKNISWSTKIYVNHWQVQQFWTINVKHCSIIPYSARWCQGSIFTKRTNGGQVDPRPISWPGVYLVPGYLKISCGLTRSVSQY